MTWFNTFIASSSNATILLVGALGTASLAVVISMLSHQLLFSANDEALEAHGKLAEVVHGSLLAFAVFVLALALTDVRSNFGKADDAALREASVVTRLARELRTIGGDDAEAAVERLKEYVQSAIGPEWKTLSQPEPALSADTDKAMAALVAQVHRVVAASPTTTGNLRELMDSLEDMREGRLENATKSVPSVFWWVTAVFVVGAMVMNGRHKLGGFGTALITLHMGAIGMVVALILIMDSPFRGETSVSPKAMARAIGLPDPRK